MSSKNERVGATTLLKSALYPSPKGLGFTPSWINKLSLNVYYQEAVALPDNARLGSSAQKPMQKQPKEE